MKTLEFHSTTSDQALIEAIQFIIAEEAVYEKIPERHLLDVIVRIERLTGFGRHLGPLSGNEPKTDDAWERQVLAIFAYGTNYVELARRY